MTELLHLYNRITHKYVGTCRHMDEEEYFGTIRQTKPVRLDLRGDDPDPSEGPTIISYARLPAGMDPKKAIRAIEDTLSAWGCHHEYDCCGCASYRAEARMISRRQVKITINVTYNY